MPNGVHDVGTDFQCSDLAMMDRKRGAWLILSKHGGDDMTEGFPIHCPTCGSADTLRTKGPQGLCETCCQQRHECRSCGQRFLAFWEISGLRPYGAKPVVEGVDDMPVIDATFQPVEVADAGA